MYIKNNYLSVILKILIVVIGTYGLYKACFFNKVGLGEHFSYYTNLSNLICIIYFLILLIKCIISRRVVEANPLVKGSMTILISITAIVYNFILRPFMTDMDGVMDLHSISNYIVHIVVPILIILDWILFDKKGEFKNYYPFIWLILPFMYFIFICVRAFLGKTFTYTSSRYPYFFLDIDEYGLLQVIFNVLVAIKAILILGFIVLKIDKFLNKSRGNAICQN